MAAYYDMPVICLDEGGGIPYNFEPAAGWYGKSKETGSYNGGKLARWCFDLGYWRFSTPGAGWLHFGGCSAIDGHPDHRNRTAYSFAAAAFPNDSTY
jgi:hypothetical protein